MKSLLFLIVIISCVFANDANYADTTKWPAKNCKGSKQSPINLPNPRLYRRVSSFSFDVELSPKSLKTKPQGISLQNDAANASVITLGKSLNLKYTSSAIHFHTPSEHTIDGGKGDLEMHLVHKLNSGFTAPRNTLAVIGFIFNVSKTEKGPLDHVDFTKAGNTFNLRSLLGNWINKQTFYNYEGSLTTPTCDEAVQWFVSKKVLPISAATLAKFKAALNHGKTNNRPVQALSNRPIQWAVEV